MKVLITGITGFVGSQLAEKLTNEGCIIAGLVRPNKKNENKLLYSYDRTFLSVKNAVDTFKPDVIIHLATTYTDNDSDAIDSLASTNISLPLFLFEATKHSSVKIICAGSYWQFGNQENDSPIDIYSASKTAAERLVEYYALKEKRQAIFLYFYGIYGIHDKRGKILDYILQSIVENKKLELSPGEQKLNLVHINDVINALQIIIYDDTLLPGKLHRFGVYSESSYTLKEIISICQSYSSSHVNVEFGAIPYRERELMEPQYPYPNVPGWNEKIILKDFIKNFLIENI